MSDPLDCRSDAGETVGLIDAIIHVARVAAARDLSHPEVREALADLRSEPALRQLLMEST